MSYVSLCLYGDISLLVVFVVYSINAVLTIIDPCVTHENLAYATSY